MSERKQPLHTQFMRRQAIAYELGVSRGTLARIIKKDADFPRFFALSPGIEVIERAAFERWIQTRRVIARHVGAS